MHSFSSTLAAGVLLASIAVAAPVQPTKRSAGYTVTGTVAKPLPAYPVQLANVYKKYGKTVPVHVQAAAASESGSVPAIPEASDIAYLSQIKIGGQTLNVDFDTGSADLYVTPLFPLGLVSQIPNLRASRQGFLGLVFRLQV